MVRPEVCGAMVSTAAPRRPAAKRRLILNADDFGCSSEINAAIIQAHTQGVLTTASLMVNEDGFEEAISLARLHPTLGVGLHLTLVCGRSALASRQIPNLVNAQQRFSSAPIAAGLSYFFRRSSQRELKAEIDAQFERFHATGLQLDHINGHLHFHLHPTILPMVLANAARYGVSAIRVTNDPFWLNARLANGRWGYRASHAAVFQFLSRRARAQLKRTAIGYAPLVFGLLQHSHVDEDFILRLLPRLPAGDSELYSHPSLTQFRHELDALLSPKVKRRLSELGIDLIRYQDL